MYTVARRRDASDKRCAFCFAVTRIPLILIRGGFVVVVQHAVQQTVHKFTINKNSGVCARAKSAYRNRL